MVWVLANPWSGFWAIRGLAFGRLVAAKDTPTEPHGTQKRPKDCTPARHRGAETIQAGPPTSHRDAATIRQARPRGRDDDLGRPAQEETPGCTKYVQREVKNKTPPEGGLASARSRYRDRTANP